MSERKRAAAGTQAELTIDEIPFDGLQMLSTGGAIAADDAIEFSHAEARRGAEEYEDTAAHEPPPARDAMKISPNRSAATVSIAVPAGYTLDPIWQEIDDETRAAALTCTSTMLGAGVAIGKVRATDVDLRRALLDVQRQFAESRVRHAEELTAERTKLESEVNFLKKDLSVSLSKIGETVSAA